MNYFLNATLPTWKITPTNSRQVSVRRSEKKKKKKSHREPCLPNKSSKTGKQDREFTYGKLYAVYRSSKYQ